MLKETIVDNESITMWYYPNEKIIAHRVHKFIRGQILRDALLKGTEVLKQNGAQKWLSDDRNNVAIPAAELEWGKTVWVFQAMEAGWKYWALVQPEMVIGQLSMRRLIQSYAEVGLIVQLFSDPEKALEWLNSV
ncbi:MAG: hypothetical protein ACFFCZ_14380 [Promethearchaeota archaeon]